MTKARKQPAATEPAAASAESDERRFEFTGRNVLTLAAPEAGRLFYWDTSKDSPRWFGVRVNAPGPKRGKVFRVYVQGYRLRGKEHLLTLGKVGPLALEDARKKARAEVEKVAAGRDPLEEKRNESQPSYTVATLAKDWLADGRVVKKGARTGQPWREKTRREFQRLVDKVLNGKEGEELAGLHPSKVKRPHIRSLLDSVRQRSPSTASHVHAVLRMMFAWGQEHDRIDAIPTFPRKEHQPTPRKRRLTRSEIRRVWNVLEGKMGDGSPLPEGEFRLGRLGEAFRLMLLTAQRRGEVLSMRWPDVDLVRRVWTIPADQTKNGRGQRVPLTKRVIGVLTALKAVDDDEAARAEAEGRQRLWGEYVFRSPRPPRSKEEKAQPFITNPQKTAARLWKRAGITERTTLHDLRRTAATQMGKARVPRADISLVLNHRKMSVTGIYELAPRMPEKRAALQAWDRRLTAILSSTDAEEQKRRELRNVLEFGR